MQRPHTNIAGFVHGKDACAPMRVVQGWCAFIGIGLSWLGLAGPFLFEIEARFPILEYYNPAKELKIVHRAFWKFAHWPGINESPHTSSGGKFIMGPGLSQEDL